METRSTSTWAAGVGLLLAWAAPAGAQEHHQTTAEAMQGGGVTEERTLSGSDEQARAHFRAGRSLYDAGRFRQAAEEFEEAFRLSGRAELLFNAYVAYRDANDLEGAVRSLGTYLERTPNAPDRINLEARLRSMTSAVDEARARQAELERTQQEVAEARATPPPAGGGEVWPWILMGGGAAVAVGGVVTGFVALGEADSLVAACPGNECDGSVDLDARRSSASTLALVTDLLLFGGGAVAVVGLVLGIALSGGGGAEARGDVQVEASCGPAGCGALLRARF